MASYKTRAIVLKKTKLKETDLILTMLSEEGSQIRCVAKGARKPGNTFSARLELLSVADLMLHEGKNLDIVSEARVVQTNEACRADIEHLSYGAVISEFLEKTSMEGQGSPVLFPMTIAALDALGKAQDSALSFIVSAYLIKAIAYLGYKPSFDECTICGIPATESAKDMAPSDDELLKQYAGGLFTISAGGWICPQCCQFEGGSGFFDDNINDQSDTGDQDIAGQTNLDVVLPTVVEWIKALLAMKLADISVAVSNIGEKAGPLSAELNHFCERWIEQHLGIRLKSLNYLSRVTS